MSRSVGKGLAGSPAHPAAEAAGARAGLGVVGSAAALPRCLRRLVPEAGLGAMGETVDSKFCVAVHDVLLASWSVARSGRNARGSPGSEGG